MLKFAKSDSDLISISKSYKLLKWVAPLYLAHPVEIDRKAYCAMQWVSRIFTYFVFILTVLFRHVNQCNQ